MLPDDFSGGIDEEPFSRRVERFDDSSLVGREDAVRGSVEDGRLARFAFAQGAFGPPLVGTGALLVKRVRYGLR